MPPKRRTFVHPNVSAKNRKTKRDTNKEKGGNGGHRYLPTDPFTPGR